MLHCHLAFRAVLGVAVQNRPSVVDDQFFKLSEMEHFLEHEDRREAGQHSSSDESVDLFQLSDSDAEVCLFVPSYIQGYCRLFFCVFLCLPEEI